MLRILVSCIVILCCSCSGENDQNTPQVVVVTPGSNLMEDEPDTTLETDQFLLPEDFGDTPAPSGISITVLSDASAELEWIEPLKSDGILANEIWRDGILVETISGDLISSYVDFDRIPRTAYTYHIVAISSSGRATTKFIETNGTHPNPPWSPNNSNELPALLSTQLDNTFELVKGTAMHKLLAFAIKVNNTTPEALGLLFTGENESGLMSYTCPDGGTISLGQKIDILQEFTASDCSIFPITYDGGLTIVDGGLTSADGVIASDNGTITKYTTNLLFSAGTNLFDARDNSSITTSQSTATLRRQSYTILTFSINDLKVSRPDHNYSATYFEFSSNAIYFDFKPDPSIVIRGFGIEGALGKVSRLRTMGFFEGSLGRPITGSLAISSMNIGNESYGINADSNIQDSFTLNATVDDTLTRFDLTWSDKLSFSFPDASEIDLGI